MIVLGLDVSSVKVGYSLYETDTDTIIESGIIKLSNKTDHFTRMIALRSKLNEMFVNPKIKTIVLEDVPPVINHLHSTMTFAILCQYKGCVGMTAAETGMPYTFIQPRVVRSKLGFKGAKGQTTKKHFHAYLFTTYPHIFNKTQQEDVVDATALAKAYAIINT